MKPIVNHKWRKSSPAEHKTYGEKRERDLKSLEELDKTVLDKETYVLQLEDYFGCESKAKYPTKESAAKSASFKNLLEEYFIVDWNQVDKWNNELFNNNQYRK